MVNDSTPEPLALDRAALKRAFDRAGAQYDAAARLQQRVRAELLTRLQFFALTPSTILDLGAGTCQASEALQRRFPRARVLAVDIAPGMLAAAPRQPWWRRQRVTRLCADAYALPLAAHSVDLVFSNLMLQWCDQPQQIFAQLARVLKPRGLLLFSSLGPDTLQELREAWAAADAGAHVNAFIDLPQLGEALMHAGLTEPVMDVEHERLYYDTPRALMQELQRIGARNASQSRARGLTGRARLQRMLQAYEAQRGARGIPATYEVIYAAAFAAASSDASGAGGGAPAGEFAVPLSSLRRRQR